MTRRAFGCIVLAVLPGVAAEAQSEASTQTCVADATTLCLNGDRFRVAVHWETENESGDARAMELTGDTGYFWFFNQENIELAVKVLDGRGINGRFWLLYGALSDVEYEITATDTATGKSKPYRNEAGSICGEVDTDAF